MMDLIQSIFDQNMREDVRKKVSANMNELVDMGCYIGGPIPIGLSIEEVEIDGKKRKKYCLGDKKEIELVKNIFKWYLEDDRSQLEVVRLADEQYAELVSEDDLKKYRKNGSKTIIMECSLIVKKSGGYLETHRIQAIWLKTEEKE
ncbi:hypothetical protein ACSLGF_13980 [Bacillus sp. A015]